MILKEFVKQINKKLDYFVVEVDENDNEINRYPFIIGCSSESIPAELQNATITNIEINNEILYLYILK